jgi:hypothetical protein
VAIEVWYVYCVFANIAACVKIFPFCFLCETFVCERNDSDVFFNTQEKSGSNNWSVCMLFGVVGGNLGKCHIDFIYFCMWKKNDNNDGNFCVWFGEKKLLQFGVVQENWKQVIMAIFFWWKMSNDVSFCVWEDQWWWFLYIREKW